MKNLEPITREETMLAKVAGQDVPTLEPITREEYFLADVIEAIESGGGGGGISNAAKQALLDCFAHVAWVDENGQDYYDALEAALNPPVPPVGLVSISAVYTQSGTVYDTDTLDSLKADLVVTATYEDSTTAVVTNYTLSGTLAEGTSTITVSYGGKTTSFTVTVTHKQASGDNVWYDGAAYENLTIVQNEYVKSADGTFAAYAGWDRTGYVYCEGASSITFPPMPEEGSGLVQSSQFYQNNTGTRIGKITLSRTESTIVTVPSNAKYFAISSNRTALAACINAGIVPHA